MSQKQPLCDCEQPGAFHCGVPGVLAALENGKVPLATTVERCDQCRRFESDALARARLVELGLAEALPPGWQAFTVHCFAVVRIRFPGVLAPNPQAAAQQAMDRLDWDAHGRTAEFADEIAGTLVDFDGDDDHQRTVAFDRELLEVRKHGTCS